MKTRKAISKFILFVATCSIAACSSLSSRAQTIDQTTGLPSASARPATVNHSLTAMPSGPINHDAKTGLPMFYTPGATMQSGRTMNLVEALMTKSQYEEALQLLLDNHQQLKLDEPLHMLVLDWIELGRRFPKARAALIEIRDQYQNDFSAGRGFPLLFGEINTINSQLDQDDATYALFQSIRKNDKKLAEQCFESLAPLLIRRNEFDLCLSYITDPKEYFISIQKVHEKALDDIRRQTDWQRQIDQRQAKINQRLRLTNNLEIQAVTDDFAAMQNKTAADDFVNATRQLIRILVGAGHKTEAEEIQKQAMAFLDDARLKSAVSDAAEITQSLPARTDKK
jgi:hypothetical protein